MKASEAIHRLTFMIESWGDREIKQCSPEYYPEGDRYYFSAKSVTDLKYCCHEDLDDPTNYFEFW